MESFLLRVTDGNGSSNDDVIIFIWFWAVEGAVGPRLAITTWEHLAATSVGENASTLRIETRIKWQVAYTETMMRDINYGEGGLQNGKNAGPKLFAPPPSRQDKMFCTTPFLHPPISMAKTSSSRVKTTSTNFLRPPALFSGDPFHRGSLAPSRFVARIKVETTVTNDCV